MRASGHHLQRQHLICIGNSIHVIHESYSTGAFFKKHAPSKIIPCILGSKGSKPSMQREKLEAASGEHRASMMGLMPTNALHHQGHVEHFPGKVFFLQKWPTMTEVLCGRSKRRAQSVLYYKVTISIHGCPSSQVWPGIFPMALRVAA